MASKVSITSKASIVPLSLTTYISDLLKYYGFTGGLYIGILQRDVLHHGSLRERFRNNDVPDVTI